MVFCVTQERQSGMYQISKEFSFSAAHHLDGLEVDHPCARMHGHNYVVRVIVRGEDLNHVGFVVDYRDLDPLKQWIDATLDHRVLNDVFNVNPTAENLSKEIATVVRDVCRIPATLSIRVAVSETPKTWAEFCGNHH